jgi:hypothetical protein
MVAEFIWFHRLHFKLVVMVDWWWSVSEVRAAERVKMESSVVMVVDDIAFLPAEFVFSAVLQIFSLNI